MKGSPAFSSIIINRPIVQTPLLAKAIQIASQAHMGQVDKGGAPYILHPLRLMMQMDTEEEKIAAVLHDVVEDIDWNFAELKKEGFNEKALDAIDHLTRREEEPYENFIERVKNNPLAIKVKIADLKDNLDVTRLETMTPKDLERLNKYQQALQNLNMTGKSS